MTQDNVEKAAAFLASVTNDTSAVDGNSVVSASDFLSNIVDLQDTSPEVILATMMSAMMLTKMPLMWISLFDDIRKKLKIPQKCLK